MARRKRMLLFKKWFLLLFFNFLFLTLQSTEVFSFVFNIKPVIIFPFAICCCVFLKKEEAAIFGFICGFFLDCFSDFIFGFSSVILLYICTLTSVVCKKYIDVHLANIVFLNFALFFCYCFFMFTFKYLIFNFDCVWDIWLYRFIPNVIYTTIITPVIFLISKKICYSSSLKKIQVDKEKKYKKEQSKSHEQKK